MQRYRPPSMEELGIEHFLTPAQLAIFLEHHEVANRRKLAEKMGVTESKLYRLLRAYQKTHAKDGKG